MDLARELIDLHEKPREVPPFHSATRHDGGERLCGGMAPARAPARAGWRPVGRKIGFTNRTLWDRYGVHEPMWGWVYDRTLIEAQDNEANVRLDELVQPRIEPEIAFK
jgi:2-oxo-3-hexenedioate decarboxylase